MHALHSFKIFKSLFVANHQHQSLFIVFLDYSDSAPPLLAPYSNVTPPKTGDADCFSEDDTLPVLPDHRANDRTEEPFSADDE